MGFVTTAGSVAVVLGASSLYLLRRRISKKWIDCSSRDDDLSGKLVVITGGNVGLGFEAAKDLANRKARVILACRNVSKGQEAVQAIQVATGNSAVECLELDLASLSSVRMFCSELKSKYYPPIHVLILNAGVWVPMELHEKTSDGYEIHFGVNHLAHYEMVRLLVNGMAKESSARIVFVSSTLAKSGRLNFQSLDFVKDGRVIVDPNSKPSFAPTGYCDSKLMNALTCRHLATTLPPHVTTYAVCPGFCRSRLGRHVTFPLYKRIWLTPIMRMLQRTAQQGAQNIVFASIEDTDKLTNGGFYRDGEVEQDVVAFMDSLGSEAPQQLWTLSDKLVTET